MAFTNYQVVLDGEPTDVIYDNVEYAKEFIRNSEYGNRATISEIHDFPDIKRCLRGNLWTRTYGLREVVSHARQQRRNKE